MARNQLAHHWRYVDLTKNFPTNSNKSSNNSNNNTSLETNLNDFIIYPNSNKSKSKVASEMNEKEMELEQESDSKMSRMNEITEDTDTGKIKIDRELKWREFITIIPPQLYGDERSIIDVKNVSRKSNHLFEARIELFDEIRPLHIATLKRKDGMLFKEITEQMIHDQLLEHLPTLFLFGGVNVLSQHNNEIKYSLPYALHNDLTHIYSKYCNSDIGTKIANENESSHNIWQTEKQHSKKFLHNTLNTHSNHNNSDNDSIDTNLNQNETIMDNNSNIDERPLKRRKLNNGASMDTSSHLLSNENNTNEMDNIQIETNINNNNNQKHKKRRYSIETINFLCSQGPGGTFSHSAGGWRNSFDFACPVGTPVISPRDGIVVDVEGAYRKGGPDLIFEEECNYVHILFDDGSVCDLVHLRADSLQVEKGDFVKCGQIVAYSGNTGFSGEPHIHMMVYVHRLVPNFKHESLTKNSNAQYFNFDYEAQWQTLPIKFKCAKEELKEYKRRRNSNNNCNEYGLNWCEVTPKCGECYGNGKFGYYLDNKLSKADIVNVKNIAKWSKIDFVNKRDAIGKNRRFHTKSKHKQIVDSKLNSFVHYGYVKLSLCLMHKTNVFLAFVLKKNISIYYLYMCVVLLFCFVLFFLIICNRDFFFCFLVPSPLFANGFDFGFLQYISENFKRCQLFVFFQSYFDTINFFFRFLVCVLFVFLFEQRV